MHRYDTKIVFLCNFTLATASAAGRLLGHEWSQVRKFETIEVRVETLRVDGSRARAALRRWDEILIQLAGAARPLEQIETGAGVTTEEETALGGADIIAEDGLPRPFTQELIAVSYT